MSALSDEQVKQILFGGRQDTSNISNAPGLPDDEVKNILFGQESNQSTPVPTLTIPDAAEDAPVPMTTSQNIMLSLMPDSAKPKYLAQEFGGARVSQDNDGRLLVNGAPVNPRGLDLRDISQNTGYSLNFLGQVFGGIGGGALGAPAGPVGAVGGAMAGGVAGATAGDMARTSIGRMFGAPTTTEQQIGNLPEEAKIAAIGEVAGLGLNMIAKPAIKATAQAWKSGIKAAGKNADKVIEFIGGVSPDATQTILKHGVDKAVNDVTINPGRTSQIVKRVIFGGEQMKLLLIFMIILFLRVTFSGSYAEKPKEDRPE